MTWRVAPACLSFELNNRGASVRRFFILALAASCSPAFAADQIGYGPPPAWVVATPIEAAPLPPGPEDEEVVQPVRFLRTDSQSKFTAAEVSEYTALRVKVVTAEGLPIGGFSREWDPATDTLTVHRLRIERDGEVIDILRKQKFEILRRERSLEQSTLDGRLTASLQIADLRVGDIVDVAITHTRAQPVLAGANSASSVYSSSVTTDETRVRLLWDKAAPLRWRVGSGLPQAKVVETAAGGELLFEARKLVGPTPPESAPARFAFTGVIQASQVDGWPRASATFAPLFERAARLEPNSPLKAEVEKIRAAGKTPLERAGLALRLVEDQIRYVAIQMDAQGYTPAAADETWRRRYGDCKGKTALLLALLHELGVEATAALVNTYAGESLPGMLPRADAFDHVIVRAVIDGKAYWLDGTRTGDGPLESLIVPWFGWALPLTTEGSELVRLRPERLARPSTQYTLRMDMSGGFETEAPVVLEVIDRDINAGALARAMQAAPKAQLQRGLISRYGDSYDRMTFTEATWRYDERQSRLIYTLKGVAQPDVQVSNGRNRYEIPGSAVYVPQLKLRPKDQDQSVPYNVDDTDYVRRLTIIKLPKDTDKYAVYGAPTFIGMAGERRTRWASKEGDEVIMLRSTRGVVEEISAEEAAVDVDLLKTLRSTVALITTRADDAESLATDGSKAVDVRRDDDLLGEGRNRLTLTGYMGVDVDRKMRLAALGDARRKELVAFGARISGMVTKRDFAGALKALDETKLDLSPLSDNFVGMRASLLRSLQRRPEALALLDREIAKAPASTLLLLRSSLLSEAGRDEAAAADRAAAFALAPDDLAVLHGLVSAPEVRKDPARLADLRRRIVRLQPDEPEAWLLLARAEEALGRATEAAQAYEDAQEAGAAGTTALTPRARLLTTLRRLDEANAAWDAVVALRPNNAQSLNEACWGRAIVNLSLDKARAECERAVGLEPDKAPYRDSLAFVKLRQGRLDEAVADYDRALKLSPTLPASLYGRGVAKIRLGQTAAGEADLAAARVRAPRIDDSFKGYGVTP